MSIEQKRTSRRDFLKKTGIVGATMALGVMAEPLLGASGPAFAATGGPFEPIPQILGLALTAEQLATTFYYMGINSTATLPQSTNSGNIPYLQAALDAENFHAQLLADAGGVSLAGPNPMFYFPQGTFANDNNFLAVLNALETAFIEAYLAAIYQFGSQGRSDLAQVAGEIMGVEAEHRVLGRQILTDFTSLKVPNNLLLEEADGTSVAVVAQALIPFLSANNFGGASDGPYALPSQSQIAAAVGSNVGINPNTAGASSSPMPGPMMPGMPPTPPAPPMS